MTTINANQPVEETLPLFSVIIATRNRPTVFRQALKSVLAQSCSDTEIIVVNDGSASEYKSEYEAILGSLNLDRIRSFNLISRQKGYGAGYARNFGAARASAPFVCFLDDDDCWIDEDHLSRAQKIILNSRVPIDLYMTNQVAFLGEERRPGPIWIEDLPAILDRAGHRPDRHGAHIVAVDELLCSQGFCHLNTLIIRRRLYEDVGGMEETIRWEEDRDLYFRLIDRATMIKYVPITVARHNIPDPTTTTNMTTALSEVERRMFQLTVLNRALLFARHPAIRAYACRHKGYTLKWIAELLAADGHYVEAARYAREALRAGPTAKWAGYTAWLTLRMLSAIVARHLIAQPNHSNSL